MLWNRKPKHHGTIPRTAREPFSDVILSHHRSTMVSAREVLCRRSSSCWPPKSSPDFFFLLVLFGTTSAGLDGTRCGFSPRQHDKYSWSAYINKFSTCHTFVKDGCCFCLRWAQIIVPFASLVICQKDGSLDCTQTWSDSFWQFAVSSAPPQSADQNKPDTKQVVFLATHNLPRWC